MDHICEIWVRDQQGRIRQYRKIKPALLMRNFGAIYACLIKLMTGQYLDSTTFAVKPRTGEVGKLFGDTGVSGTPSGWYNKSYSGAITLYQSSTQTFRVLAGTQVSPTGATIADIELENLYGEGNCGPAQYAEDVPTGKIRISTSGDVSFSGAETCTEVGLAFGCKTTVGTAYDFLMARDLPSPSVPVGAGQTLTVKYTWEFN